MPVCPHKMDQPCVQPELSRAHLLPPCAKVGPARPTSRTGVVVGCFSMEDAFGDATAPARRLRFHLRVPTASTHTNEPCRFRTSHDAARPTHALAPAQHRSGNKREPQWHGQSTGWSHGGHPREPTEPAGQTVTRSTTSPSATTCMRWHAWMAGSAMQARMAGPATASSSCVTKFTSHSSNPGCAGA